MTSLSDRPRPDAIAGCLLGQIVGDAIGLPREGLSPARSERWFGREPRHALLPFGRGMVSDDAQHAWMTAQSLLAAPDDSGSFQRDLAWRLRWWLACLPAGIGLATLRSTAKLWLGFPPERAGVWSAGNGPAMRSPILGAAMALRPVEELREFCRRSTLLTHRDPRAERGAFAAALATRRATLAPEPGAFDRDALLDELESLAFADDAEAGVWLATLRMALRDDLPPLEFLDSIGCKRSRGATGYMYHTIPAALWAWLGAPPGDYASTLRRSLSLGGDADTIGAIAGAFAGALGGERSIPPPWIDGIVEFPRGVAWSRRLGERLWVATDDEVRASGGNAGPLPWAWPLEPVRSALFMTVVLAHGLRRLIPF